jgi:hypothetical protein
MARFPEGVADGDGMTRPAEMCAYAPREKITGRQREKPRETEVVMTVQIGENHFRPENEGHLTR